MNRRKILYPVVAGIISGIVQIVLPPLPVMRGFISQIVFVSINVNLVGYEPLKIPNYNTQYRDFSYLD